MILELTIVLLIAVIIIVLNRFSYIEKKLFEVKNDLDITLKAQSEIINEIKNSLDKKTKIESIVQKNKRLSRLLQRLK